jgi:hypothetical protein
VDLPQVLPSKILYHAQFCIPSIPLIHFSNISNASNIVLPYQHFSTGVARHNGVLRTFQSVSRGAEQKNNYTKFNVQIENLKKKNW